MIWRQSGSDVYKWLRELGEQVFANNSEGIHSVLVTIHTG